MTHETLRREVHIDARPDIVFDVVSRPEHVEQWWPDRAAYDPEPGGSGHIDFGDCDAGGKRVAFTVVDARPPRLFSFRWTHELGERPPRRTRCWSRSSWRRSPAARCCG